MPEYFFTGKHELSGVTFYVEADNEDEARAKAKAGDWFEYDTGCAECINTEVDVSTLEANE